MKKGIIKVVLFYGIGLLLTILVFLLSGRGHDAGLYPFVVVALTVITGFFWTLLSLYKFYFKERSDERKGIIYTQLVVNGVVVIFVFYMRVTSGSHSNESNVIRGPELEEELFVISGKDTTTLTYGKTIILLKVKGSILIDKRDSLYATFPQVDYSENTPPVSVTKN